MIKHSIVFAAWRSAALWCALAVFAVASVNAQVPAPTITGPIAAPGIPGAAEHNYIFFATNQNLAMRGYVEEEFFIQGTANRYNTPAGATASIVDKDHPYKTRIVVRRPADPKRFNGTVLVEWDNVTNNFDAENMWFFSWEHMLRAGFVWVGVSAQQAGVTALKTFSAPRYGTIDVTQGGTIMGDALSFDIFSQAGQAIKNPKGADPLGGLKARHVIAIGESQSAGRLATYINSVNPLGAVYDGFLLLSTSTKIRTDVPVPVWKISAEYDVVGFAQANARQPDTDLMRSWEVAGTSHVDHHLRQGREPLELRDIGTSSEAAMAPRCGVPDVGTRVPIQYVLASAYDLLVRWVEKHTPPPSSPLLTITSTGTPIVVARDSNGLALGGIRLADVAVPTGVNNGTNTGPGACNRWGYYQPFSVATLNKLYPTHQSYVSAVERVTNENLKSGYILKSDAESIIRQARDSAIGRLDSLDAERERPMSDFDRAP